MKKQTIKYHSNMEVNHSTTLYLRF